MFPQSVLYAEPRLIRRARLPMFFYNTSLTLFEKSDNTKRSIAVPSSGSASLFRRLYVRVAADLGFDASYVNRVARGERRSKIIEEAVRRGINKILASITNKSRRSAKQRSTKKAHASFRAQRRIDRMSFRVRLHPVHAPRRFIYIIISILVRISLLRIYYYNGKTWRLDLVAVRHVIRLLLM